MKETVKNVAKSGLMMFAVGVLLAMVAVPLAMLLGPEVLGQAAYDSGISTPVLWTGLFFGGFGAIREAVAPVMDHIFSPEKKETASAEEKAPSKHVHIHIHKIIPQQDHDVVHSKHRLKLEKKRLAVFLADNNNQRMPGI